VSSTEASGERSVANVAPPPSMPPDWVVVETEGAHGPSVFVPAPARDSVRARLEAYQAARADIASAVRDAHALGMGPVEIAALSGLTRQGVRKILDRPQSHPV
jgi:hypothetical protein